MEGSVDIASYGYRLEGKIDKKRTGRHGQKHRDVGVRRRLGPHIPGTFNGHGFRIQPT